MNTPKSIVIICSGLYTAGGIERAVVNNANLFAGKGHATTLLVLDAPAGSFYPINNEVQVVHRNFNFGITASGNIFSRKLAFFKQVHQLSKLLQSLGPDVIISTEYQFTVAAAIHKKRIGARLISWEHHQFYWLQKNRFWQKLYNWYYPKTDGVVCLNHTEAPFYEKMGCRVVVIYNYAPHLPKTASSLTTKTLLTIGWLIKRKGVDLIPEIAQGVFKKHPDWKWLIIGSGPLQPAIEKEIAAKGLTDKISLLPPVSPEMDSFYSNAALVVQLSRSESFGLVLMEALAHGVPCIASDCLSGPSEVLTHGQDGLLVPVDDTAGFIAAINTLIENEPLRRQMGTDAQKNVKKFSADTIYTQWEKGPLSGLPNPAHPVGGQPPPSPPVEGLRLNSLSGSS